MQNILLIDNVDLPLETAYKFPYASPPIGIQYLAAYLRQCFNDRLGTIKVVSLPLAVLEKRDTLAAILEELGQLDYHLVGIRSLSSGREYLEIVSAGIKEKYPSIPIIVGGPYASDSAELILNDHAAVDYACSREDEEILREFVEAGLFGERETASICGLGFRTLGKAKLSELMPLIGDLDQLPCPGYGDVSLLAAADRKLDYTSTYRTMGMYLSHVPGRPELHRSPTPGSWHVEPGNARRSLPLI